MDHSLHEQFKCEVKESRMFAFLEASLNILLFKVISEPCTTVTQDTSAAMVLQGCSQAQGRFVLNAHI